jgi:hypothetical protein
LTSCKPVSFSGTTLFYGISMGCVIGWCSADCHVTEVTSFNDGDLLSFTDIKL